MSVFECFLVLKNKKIRKIFRIFGVLAGIRTLDPLIKSQLLYQLSYEDKCGKDTKNIGAICTKE